MALHVKRDDSAPPGFFACEAAGLRWLAAADGGAACAEVIDHGDTALVLTEIRSRRPDPAAARAFGGRLARTHAAGARAFGAAPDGWTGDGFFGPMGRALPMSMTEHTRWGVFTARERLEPMARRAAPLLGADLADAVADVAHRCARGDFDDDEPPSRIHGDLWNGNVMWTADGAVLIDPAAHGGHRETDLAMLALFGCPHLGEILAGYQAVWPLRTGWADRVALHQLFPLLAHVVLFGGGYVGQTAQAVRSVLTSAG